MGGGRGGAGWCRAVVTYDRSMWVVSYARVYGYKYAPTTTSPPQTRRVDDVSARTSTNDARKPCGRGPGKCSYAVLASAARGGVSDDGTALRALKSPVLGQGDTQ
jgi:hypothetical protein